MRYLILFLLVISQSILADTTIYTVEKPEIIVSSKNPEFKIKLKSNPTTGFSWFLKEYETTMLVADKHQFEAPDNTNSHLVGAPGYEVWTFHVKPAGFVVPRQTLLRFIYLRPWSHADSVTQVVFQVVTTQ